MNTITTDDIKVFLQIIADAEARRDAVQSRLNDWHREHWGMVMSQSQLDRYQREWNESEEKVTKEYAELGKFVAKRIGAHDSAR